MLGFSVSLSQLSLNKGMVINEWNMETEIEDGKGNVGRERAREGGRCYCVVSCFSNSIHLTISGSLKWDERQS